MHGCTLYFISSQMGSQGLDKNDSIILKAYYKDGAVVVTNKDKYIEEALE